MDGINDIEQPTGDGEAKSAEVPAPPNGVLYQAPLSSGKKRAGYTTRKRRGTPKAKRRMAERSRRINRRRGC